MEIDNTNGAPETLEAFITAKRVERKQIKKRFVFLSILLLMSLVLLVCPLRFGVVDGDSMEPTLQPHQVFLYNSKKYTNTLPAKNDVIIFEQNKDILIKRVVGLPGEWIWYYTVEGSLERSFIPDDTVFVLGDNVMHSSDSRTFGPITVRSIIGKVTYPDVNNVKLQNQTVYSVMK